MGSLTFSEMATIAVVVLIVFGPERLPELARRGGAMLSRVREASREIQDELRQEYQETISPLQEVRDDLKAVRADLTEAAASMEKDFNVVTGESAEPDKPKSRGGPTSLVPLEDLRDELAEARSHLAQTDIPEEPDGKPEAVPAELSQSPGRAGGDGGVDEILDVGSPSQIHQGSAPEGTRPVLQAIREWLAGADDESLDPTQGPGQSGAQVDAGAEGDDADPGDRISP